MIEIAKQILAESISLSGRSMLSHSISYKSLNDYYHIIQRRVLEIYIKKSKIKIASIIDGVDYIPTFIPEVNSKGRPYVKVDDDTKAIMQKITKCFQRFVNRGYVYGCIKRKGNVKNALKHCKNKYVIAMDIKHFFQNTQAKYLRQFYTQHFSESVCNKLIQWTTYKGHLATGLPTSPVLSYLAHKQIFDDIHDRMLAIGIKMTLYYDDIVLSAPFPIGDGVIRYVKKSLKQHGLWLKKNKTRKYGIKGARVTGAIIRSQKLYAPNKNRLKIIKMLRNKKIEKMDQTELRSLISRIGYVQLFDKNSFNKTKKEVIKIFKLKDKEESNEKNKSNNS